MRRHAPFGPTDPNFCVWGGVTDVINCAKFFENLFRSSRAGRPWKMAFPIESVHRPYNSAALPVINNTANMDDGRELWATKYWIHIEDTHCGHSQQTHIVDTHTMWRHIKETHCRHTLWINTYCGHTHCGHSQQTHIVDKQNRTDRHPGRQSMTVFLWTSSTRAAMRASSDLSTSRSMSSWSTCSAFSFNAFCTTNTTQYTPQHSELLQLLTHNQRCKWDVWCRDRDVGVKRQRDIQKNASRPRLQLYPHFHCTTNITSEIIKMSKCILTGLTNVYLPCYIILQITIKKVYQHR